MKKIVSIVLALALTLLCVGAAFAAWTGNGGDKTITVKNALNGETYSIYKLFDATTDGTNIAYTLPTGVNAIPSQVSGIFQQEEITIGTGTNTKTYDAITKIGDPTDAAVQAALLAWATSSAGAAAKVGEITCADNKVEFTNLKDGYYVIVSTFSDGDSETVEKVIGTSTNQRGLTVYEKNETKIVVGKNAANDFSIGDTITYTVDFNGANYDGKEDDARIIYEYVVEDTLPEFLKDVTVTSIKIGNTEYKGTDLNNTKFPGVESFGSNKSFKIPWASGTHNTYKSLYPNNTKVVITYTAVLTQVVKIDGKEKLGNKNTVTITPKNDTPDGKEPREEHYKDSHEVFTYGAALKKINSKTGEEQKLLKGAKFHFKGLELVPEKAGTKGIYRVVSYDPTATTYGTEVEVGDTGDDEGFLYILGLASSVELTGEETQAPEGYNMLTSTFTLSPEVMEKNIWSYTEDKYWDEDGNLTATAGSSTAKEVVRNIDDLGKKALPIVNNEGVELPHTGGIGTTIFYILGGLLVVGAAVILVARRKAQD